MEKVYFYKVVNSGYDNNLVLEKHTNLAHKVISIAKQQDAKALLAKAFKLAQADKVPVSIDIVVDTDIHLLS